MLSPFYFLLINIHSYRHLNLCACHLLLKSVLLAQCTLNYLHEMEKLQSDTTRKTQSSTAIRRRMFTCVLGLNKSAAAGYLVFPFLFSWQFIMIIGLFSLPECVSSSSPRLHQLPFSAKNSEELKCFDKQVHSTKIPFC